MRHTAPLLHLLKCRQVGEHIQETEGTRHNPADYKVRKDWTLTTLINVNNYKLKICERTVCTKYDSEIRIVAVV